MNKTIKQSLNSWNSLNDKQRWRFILGELNSSGVPYTVDLTNEYTALVLSEEIYDEDYPEIVVDEDFRIYYFDECLGIYRGILTLGEIINVNFVGV